MSELRIKVFKRLLNGNWNKVNDFLKEIGDSVVKVDSHASGSDNSCLDFIVTYKHSKYNSTNSDIRVEYLGSIIKLNEFLEKIGDRFISKEISNCSHYVTYYVPKTTNTETETETEKESKRENALG
jgi:hypothetical protein